MTVACGESRICCTEETSIDYAVLTGGTGGPIDLNNGAWCAYNVDDLLGESIRGGDLLVPGADRVLPRDRYLDVIEASVQMVFDGNVDQDGYTHAPLDVMGGLEVNRRTFIAAAVRPPASPATFTLNLTVADGTVLTGPLHCENFIWARHEINGMARAVWRVSLPLGLTEVAP